jgi:hypothetical protein
MKKKDANAMDDESMLSTWWHKFWIGSTRIVYTKKISKSAFTRHNKQSIRRKILQYHGNVFHLTSPNSFLTHLLLSYYYYYLTFVFFTHALFLDRSQSSHTHNNVTKNILPWVRRERERDPLLHNNNL